MKLSLSTLLATLTLVTPALAIDATTTYHSGLFVLSFAGFCTLVVIAQMIPAVLMLSGMTKDVHAESSKRRA